MAIASDVLGLLNYLRSGDELQLQKEREADTHQEFLNEQERIKQGGQAPQLNTVATPTYNGLTGQQTGTAPSLGYDAQGNRVPLYQQPSGFSPYAGDVARSNMAWLSQPAEAQGEEQLREQIAGGRANKAIGAYGNDIRALSPQVQGILVPDPTAAGIEQAQTAQANEAAGVPYRRAANEATSLTAGTGAAQTQIATEPLRRSWMSQDLQNEIAKAKGEAPAIPFRSAANLSDARLQAALAGTALSYQPEQQEALGNRLVGEAYQSRYMPPPSMPIATEVNSQDRTVSPGVRVSGYMNPNIAMAGGMTPQAIQAAMGAKTQYTTKDGKPVPAPPPYGSFSAVRTPINSSIQAPSGTTNGASPMPVIQRPVRTPINTNDIPVTPALDSSTPTNTLVRPVTPWYNAGLDPEIDTVKDYLSRMFGSSDYIPPTNQ